MDEHSTQAKVVITSSRFMAQKLQQQQHNRVYKKYLQCSTQTIGNNRGAAYLKKTLELKMPGRQLTEKTFCTSWSGTERNIDTHAKI